MNEYRTNSQFGDALDEKQKQTPLPFSGLVLDIPKSSTFGRQPTAAGPVPYPATGIKQQAPVLPPVPDPFFLPPPFIPNHAVLRDLCKAAVESLRERHDEIDRDIREYIAQRAADMHRIEDQVRAEVEALWDRYSEGPGAGDESTRRRGSGSAVRSARSPSPAVPRQSFEGIAERRPSIGATGPRRSASRTREVKPHEVPTNDLDKISGVTQEQPMPFRGEHNVHTAQAAASLLSASLSANAFHAPPTRRRLPPEVEIEELVKTASNDSGMSREVAMSYAFSAMDEHAAAVSGRSKRQEKKEERAVEQVELQQEDTEKGIDSWINMERADAVRRVNRETAGMEVPTSTAEAVKEVQEKEEEDEEKKETVNGVKGRKVRVQFQEPTPEEKRKAKEREKAEEKGEGEERPDDDDNGGEYLGGLLGRLLYLLSPLTPGVFDFDNDNEAHAEPAVLPTATAQAARNRTMVDDNLSRAFAADAPSHRAAWRRFEARESMASVLRRQEDSDDDDGDLSTSPVVSNLARSMPVNIVLPKRERGPVQFKTSLADRGGVVVPHLLHAMRRPSAQMSAGSGSAGDAEDGGSRASLATETDEVGELGGRTGVRVGRGKGRGEDGGESLSPPTGGLRAPRNSIAIVGSLLSGTSYGGGRRGSRSGERDREAAKAYAADPGAVFEALAEAAVDSESEDDDEPNGFSKPGFVPPHVLAARRDDRPEVGWRSLAGE